MAGNVREWVADWYHEGYYGISPTHNPPGPATGTHRVDRDGGWHSGAAFNETSRRFAVIPTDHVNTLGFRCAKSP
jgi:formylglycine-generating enzyme required for sulfatase activity